MSIVMKIEHIENDYQWMDLQTELTKIKADLESADKSNITPGDTLRTYNPDTSLCVVIFNNRYTDIAKLATAHAEMAAHEKNEMERTIMTSSRKSSMEAKRRAHRKYGLLLALIALLIMGTLTGCYAQESEKITGNGFNVGEMTDKALADEKTRTLSERDSLKQEMDRMYGSGLYELDMKATEERLTKELVEKQEKRLPELLGGPVIVRCEVVYYRDSLREAQDNNVHIDDLLKAQDSGGKPFARSGITTIYGFADPSMELEALRQFKYNTSLGMSDETVLFIYPKSVLKTYNLEQIRAMEYPFIELNKVSEYFFSAPIASGSNMELIHDTKKRLKEKYHEDFECMNDFRAEYWCPVKDPSLWFDHMVENDDMYLPTLAQKRMSETINQIIEEEGGKDSIVQYSRIENTSTSNGEIFKKPYDTRNLTDSNEIFTKAYIGNFHTGLFYLLSPGETVDYDKLARISKRVKAILGEEKPEDKIKHVLRIYFYQVPTDIKPIAIEQFKKELTPDNAEITIHLTDSFEQGTLTEGDTEGFRLLRVYGERQNWYAPYVLYFEKDMTGEEFKGEFFKPLYK